MAPFLFAYTFDRYAALTGRIEVHPTVTGAGETIYRLPARSTLIAPPGEVESGKAAVFLDKTASWITVSDHRGETWWNWKGEPVKIERLGNPSLWDLMPERPKWLQQQQ